MKLNQLFTAVQAQVLWTDPAREAADIRHVIAADLMSDVLMMDLDHPLLLTSLVSDQTRGTPRDQLRARSHV